DAGVIVAARLTVHADLARRLRQRIVVGEERAAVAIATQRLAGEEAGAAEGGEIAALATLVGSPETLGGVFDHRHAMARGDGVDLVHVAALAVQRHGHDGLGAWG